MARSRTIDFYRCTRPVQDRFVAATACHAPPAPLLFRPAARTPAWLLLGASGVLVVAATVVLVAGWGKLASPLAIHRRGMLAVDVLLFGAASYCFVRATAVLRAMESLPYRAGTYVFPACVVDASGPALRVWSMAEAESVERVSDPEPALAVRLRGGGRIVVSASRPGDVERAEAALASLRPGLERALSEDDVDTLAALDPLHQTRVSSPISSTQAMRRFAPLWMRLDWLLAAAAGVALGLGLGSMRNASSDERMYRTVCSAHTIPLYREYLARGGHHSEEVRDVLLPRAELLEVEGHGGVDALRAFARDHASSKIGAEIDAAMRKALLAELDKARREGTVAALDDFARAYPDAHLDAELRAARHALYVAALATWNAKARVDATTRAFMDRLLAAAENGGRACEVRFRLEPSKTLADADKRLSKHVNYPGPDALPSRYVTPEALRPREQRVAQAVADGFASELPADIVSVRPGEPLDASAPVPASPVLVVSYSPEWSGANTASAKPRTLLAGLRFDFDARFFVPDGPPLRVLLKSTRDPELWKVKSKSGPLADFEREVYDAMMDRAFDDLRKKLVDKLFRGF